jgi:hypothetical protein
MLFLFTLFFYYRTYNPFYLTLNDYELFKFQFYSKNADKELKVLIPTSGIYFGYEGNSPFLFDWDYNDKNVVDKKTSILIGRFNLKTLARLYKDKKKLSEFFCKPKMKDIVNIFDLLIQKTIEPGEISVAGDKSAVSIKEREGDKEISLELTLPYNNDIFLYKDIKKVPLNNKLRQAIDRYFAPIYQSGKNISIIASKNSINAKLLNTRELLLLIIDNKENMGDLKQYIINLPIHDGEIKLPLKGVNHLFLSFWNDQHNKDIIIHNKLIGFSFEIGNNSLIAELFHNKLVNDILITNIKGKLNYIDKEIKFTKDDILSIYGNNLSISQITQDALTITGHSRRIIVNDQEVGMTVFSSLSGGIQILSGIIIMVLGILTFYFSFVVSVNKSKKSKKGRKFKRKGIH